MINQKDIIIIGAGLTGLTTAHYLNKNNKNFIVIDKQNTPGGVIQTESADGFVFEKGPNTGVVGNPEVVELFEDLSDKCKPELATDAVKKRYVLKNGVWHALPMGFKQAVTTPLFSLSDKFRILGEPFRSPGKNPNETLAELVLRRMGKSFLNYAIDPFILGVYAGDPNKLVTKYALPKLYNLEHKYGSFVGGTIKKGFEKKTERDKKATRKVFSVEGGLSALINALVNSAGAEKIVTGINNLRIEPNENGYLVTFVNKEGVENQYQTKKIISTVGSHALPELFPFFTTEEQKSLNNLNYAKVFSVNLGFKNWNGFKADGFGGLIPAVEKRDILGVMFMSTLFKNRAPENGASFTIFAGGVRRPDIFEMNDNDVFKIVEKEFCSLMNCEKFNPEIFRINRYQYAIPQYGAESEIRFATIDNIQKKYKGIIIGGNLIGGIGMADRIKQARELSEM